MKIPEYDKLPYVQIKKKISSAILFRRYTVAKAHMKKIEGRTKEEEYALRDSVLSASVSPFLRAVLMIGESDSHYYLSVMQCAEEPLGKWELIGSLAHMDKAALPVKEDKNIYYMKPNGLMTKLSAEINQFNLKNVSLANVHHDYVRYMRGGDSLEGVIIFHLFENGFERFEEVIRKV